MSSPRKEQWLGRFGESLGVPLVMGVGGAIDIVAGVTRRAPQLWQHLGVEWLYRLATPLLLSIKPVNNLLNRFSRCSSSP